MECHLKWIITQNGISLLMECHSKRMPLKMDCHSKLNVAPKLNITENVMSLKTECHSK